MLEQAKIRLSDIQLGESPSERLVELDGLIRSVRDSGLREPLVLTEKDHLLLSGARRFEACKKAHIQFVDAIFVADIEEGAHQLKRHLANPDPLHSRPMGTIEKVTAASALHRLPLPAGREKGFRRDTTAAAAVGLPPKVYSVLRSTLHKAQKEESSGTAGKARKSLRLMVEAVDRANLNYPLNSVVAKLHQLLLQDICPDELESCFPYLHSKPGAKNDAPLDVDTAACGIPRTRTPRRDYDYVRTADVVTGTLKGLSDVITHDLAGSEHFEYVLKALKDARRISHAYVKMMENMHNG